MVSGGNKARVIFHVDMNSFYASVEMAHHPELRGKPLAIAGKVEERHGIVVTSSYEARAKGVKTTMQVWEARKLCPNLIIKPPDFDLYRKTSQAMFDILRSYTELVQKVSIDEGYMDITDHMNERHPLELAKDIQRQLMENLQLPSSIGIAPNRFLAKMASDMKKPMGVTVLRKRDLGTMLWPLDVQDMHGVGPKTAAKLRGIGLKTIGALAGHPKPDLAIRLGQHGEKLHDHANGIDTREVDPEAESVFKSISQSTTLPKDVSSESEVHHVFKRLAGRLAVKLKAKKTIAYQVAIMIRYNNWTNVTRAKTVQQPIQVEKDILGIAMALFEKHWNGTPIRLLGIAVQGLESATSASKQLDLFTFEAEASKAEPLIDAIQKLEAKYGDDIIRRGTDSLGDNKKRF